MDLVQLNEIVANSPYSLPSFLLVVVWWTTTAIKQKDTDIKENGQQMQKHYEEDQKEAGEREKWYQKNMEWFQRFLDLNTKQTTDMANNIKDIEALLIEGGVHFESDDTNDKVSPDPLHNDVGLNRLRSKLSKSKSS